MSSKSENTMDEMSSGAVYEGIVNALAEDYFDLYYVNVETGSYVEFGSVSEEGQTKTENRGDDFFAQSKEHMEKYIYKEDLEMVKKAIDREKLLEGINKYGGTYMLQFRQLVGGKPIYVSMKATRIDGDDHHIIIGVSNVESQVKDRRAAERALEERETYKRLAALNGTLLVLYYVDPDTGRFREFNASSEYRELGIDVEGADFFKTTYKNSDTAIYSEDHDLFHAQFTRERILETIERDGVFLLDYRIMLGDHPTYVGLKAAMIEEKGKRTLIIGVFNEDVQIRQEMEYVQNLSDAKKMASIDSLTGIRNKHAYSEWEKETNERIEKEEQEPFAVVVCDVNSLKAVNDLHGHKAGDVCIKNACERICDVFNHSPVFRIGGDEFVALLFDEDYSRRQELVAHINAIPSDPSKIRIGETISAGMAEFVQGQHTSLLSVFEEADKKMYERKQYLKSTVLKETPQVEGDPEPDYISVINSRKRLLIVDDMEINREMLAHILQDDYDFYFASDGFEALEMLRSHKDEIDLVLLDYFMPNKNGQEVIAEMQVDEELMNIPVIILTVDPETELDCLKSGAVDFILKPYPSIEIVRARVAKSIELSENRELIRFTERDKKTGVLNKEYFFRYIQRLDHLYKDCAMDAMVFDVNRFHSINKQYGRQFGDLVLRSIGTSLRNLARKTGGICCREGGDTFFLYGPHMDDYEQLICEFLSEVVAGKGFEDMVNLRVGVYTEAEQEPDTEERFAKAKIAAERVRDDSEEVCGVYDL
ncbi:MAG: diguanylate cyclase [Eubacterium sp.]|nr:diguanylate cyclase [Eubacterium sp.]